MDVAQRQFVRLRAANRCEYCRLPQQAVDGTFHVEHIIAQQHTDDSSPANLALACGRCNLHKGPNLSSLDPASGQVVVLFHPRRDQWFDHFRISGPTIEGITPSGRATVHLLRMNSRHRVDFRATLIANGEF
jgi:hypothetical protein